jgi:hypothetical protein
LGLIIKDLVIILTDRFLLPDTTCIQKLVEIINRFVKSNGIQIRSLTQQIMVVESFIYMAFAENPLVGTNGIPATAR